MPQMPTRIAKTQILVNIEDKWNADPHKNADTFRQLLLDPAVELYEAYAKFTGLPANDPGVLHLKDDWFDTTTGWWLPHQPIDPVIRQGLIEACELSIADKEGRPIDCYWICAAGAAEPFEVWIGDRYHHLAVMISTAPPPPSNLSALGTEEEIVVARAGGVKIGEQYLHTAAPLPNHPVNVLRPLRA